MPVSKLGSRLSSLATPAILRTGKVYGNEGTHGIVLGVVDWLGNVLLNRSSSSPNLDRGEVRNPNLGTEAVGGHRQTGQVGKHTFRRRFVSPLASRCVSRFVSPFVSPNKDPSLYLYGGHVTYRIEMRPVHAEGASPLAKATKRWRFESPYDRPLT